MPKKKPECQYCFGDMPNYRKYPGFFAVGLFDLVDSQQFTIPNVQQLDLNLKELAYAQHMLSSSGLFNENTWGRLNQHSQYAYRLSLQWKRLQNPPFTGLNAERIVRSLSVVNMPDYIRTLESITDTTYAEEKFDEITANYTHDLLIGVKVRAP